MATIARASSRKIVDVFNPASSEIYARIQWTDQQDAKSALDNAEKASKTSKETTSAQRKNILLNLAQILKAHTESLMEILIDEARSTLPKAG